MQEKKQKRVTTLKLSVTQTVRLSLEAVGLPRPEGKDEKQRD